MAEQEDLSRVQQKLIALADQYEALKQADAEALMKYQGIARALVNPSHITAPSVPAPPVLSSRPRSAISKPRLQGKTNKAMASTVAPIVGSIYQPVFELMEQKHTIELRGEISRVYNNKDVFIELTGIEITEAQREDGNYKVNNGLEQLETAGLPRQLVQAAHPTNISLPYKVFNEKIFAKVKVTDQLLLEPFMDPEETYGYKVGVTVHVVCKTSTWHGWKGNDAGIIFYAQAISEVEEPLI